ncbi:MAG: hypothetical protein AAF226_19555 [Verrucomicrobiota bacterium]
MALRLNKRNGFYLLVTVVPTACLIAIAIWYVCWMPLPQRAPNLLRKFQANMITSKLYRCTHNLDLVGTRWRNSKTGAEIAFRDDEILEIISLPLEKRTIYPLAHTQRGISTETTEGAQQGLLKFNGQMYHWYVVNIHYSYRRHTQPRWTDFLTPSSRKTKDLSAMELPKAHLNPSVSYNGRELVFSWAFYDFQTEDPKESEGLVVFDRQLPPQ